MEHDADRIALEFRTPDALDAARAASYPFTVSLPPRSHARAGTASPALLTAENQGSGPAPLALGLHPYFGTGVLWTGPAGY